VPVTNKFVTVISWWVFWYIIFPLDLIFNVRWKIVCGSSGN